MIIDQNIVYATNECLLVFAILQLVESCMLWFLEYIDSIQVQYIWLAAFVDDKM